MANFIVSDAAINVVKQNLVKACAILESCDLKPKNNPDLVIQILSQMYAVESALQQNDEDSKPEPRSGGCCQAEGRLSIVK